MMKFAQAGFAVLMICSAASAQTGAAKKAPRQVFDPVLKIAISAADPSPKYPIKNEELADALEAFRKIQTVADEAAIDRYAMPNDKAGKELEKLEDKEAESYRTVLKLAEKVEKEDATFLRNFCMLKAIQAKGTTTKDERALSDNEIEAAAQLRARLKVIRWSAIMQAAQKRMR